MIFAMRLSRRPGYGWLDSTPSRISDKRGLVLSAFLFCASLWGCPAAGLARANPPRPSGFQLKSTGFADGGKIPKVYTCEGEDVSPALSWLHPPAGAQSFVLLVDDPDAPSGTWVHWVVYNLAARLRGLPAHVPKGNHLAEGGLQGKNDFGWIGYGGPCPPPGPAHHYHFKLYALDKKLNLPPGASEKEVLNAMKGHVLGKAQVIALFGR